MTKDEESTVTGLSVEDAATLLRLKEVIENESAVILEHRFYRGASAPWRFVCDDFDELESYIKGPKTRPGDSFWIWKFESCCRDDNALLSGAKKPNDQGMTPIGGAY
jgi:hypothetical protein